MWGRKAENDNIEKNLRTAGEQVQSIKIKLYFACVWFPFPNQIPKPIPGFQDGTDHVSSNSNTPSANRTSGQTLQLFLSSHSFPWHFSTSLLYSQPLPWSKTELKHNIAGF